MTILEQAQRGVGMAGRTSHLFFPGWNASAVSRTVGWFPESAKGTEPYEGVQPPINIPQSPHFPPSRKQKLSNLNFFSGRTAPFLPGASSFGQTANLPLLPLVFSSLHRVSFLSPIPAFTRSF